MGSDGGDPQEFSVAVTVGDGGRSTIAVAGELDLSTTEAFTRAVSEGLSAGDVLIDLENLSFMDSTGVRALNGALREAAERGRELFVRRDVQPSVAQILELTGMWGLLPVEGGG